MSRETIPERIASLEVRMDSIEKNILRELQERKENQQTMASDQRSMAADILDLKKVYWKGFGFFIAAQLGLSIFLQWVFKH